MASIVVIEDDQHIRASIARFLAESGHDVETSGTAMAGLEKAVHNSPDLVLLDLGLPDVDGTELLKMIRSVSQVPIIIITARGDDEVVVSTLDSGADDYLIKPFTTSQLAARVRAVLRRSGADAEREKISIGDLSIDVPARAAALDSDALDLSPKEFDLLVCLARRNGEVLSKRDLLAEVWREPYGGSERTVDVHLSWLRKKLGETAAEPRYLQTVFGVGVKLVDPTQ